MHDNLYTFRQNLVLWQCAATNENGMTTIRRIGGTTLMTFRRQWMSAVVGGSCWARPVSVGSGVCGRPLSSTRYWNAKRRSHCSIKHPSPRTPALLPMGSTFRLVTTYFPSFLASSSSCHPLYPRGVTTATHTQRYNCLILLSK